MGAEHESDPLIAPRGDEADEGAEFGAGEPLDAPAASEPEREPVSEPSVSSEPASSAALSEPSGAAGRSARRSEGRSRAQSPNMLPSRTGRGHVERTFVRVIATGGIVGICVAIAAIMASSNSHGWVIGLVVSLVSVVLAAILWSSRIL
jgi:hypothetical protein